MTERPILFSAPMVRALLDGTKTQTRRVVKEGGVRVMRDGNLCIAGVAFSSPDEHKSACPYGQIGNRLWVREAFAGTIAYERHGYPLKEWGNKLWYIADGEPRSGQWTRPRPSIHMPRCLSRITLEIVSVRVERLNDISEVDVIAEGVRGDQYAGLERSHARAYSTLWESINGPGSWEANPWVWVVNFKRVQP